MATIKNAEPVKLSAAAVAIAKKVGAQIASTEKVSITLGKLASEAIEHIADEQHLKAFIDTCKTHCGKAPESTVKTYMSMVRGVIRAAIVNGFEPSAGESIKEMYKAAPKGNGQNAGGKARTVKTETRDTTAPATRPMTIEDAARFIFGSADDEIVAALQWAAANTVSFVRYVKANVEADTAPRRAPRKSKAPLAEIEELAA